ncbi:MAG: CBS domain-containing protein, partial [Planctomycetota bacterium]
MIVRDVMNDYFASAHINSTVGDVMEKMLDEGLSTLLIVDDRSQLVGCIEEDLLMVAAFDEQWRNNPVSLHMERNFITIRPDEAVGQVVEKFLLHRVC